MEQVEVVPDQMAAARGIATTVLLSMILWIIIGAIGLAILS